MPKIKILKQNGELEYFDRSKLENSLKRSGADKNAIKKISDRIEDTLKEGMGTSEIYNKAFAILNKEQKKVAASYSLRNAVMDLGPTGFPFERFIGEIFKDMGFTVKVGGGVVGKCVSHEVDIVAFNREKLIMAETKFHNSHGIKSDLQVALYVKARFDDIRETEIYCNGKKMNLDEGWLITNTKFTSSAIKYGKCNNIKMVGWNYPQKGNLQDMIVGSGLHPLTCLTTLSKKQKIDLLNGGAVLCKKIKDDYNVMKSIGLDNKKIAEINKEIEQVCEI